MECLSCRNRILPAHLFTKGYKMDTLRERFKKKLYLGGRNYRWFLKKYLPDTKYSNLTTQISGFSEMSENIKKGIEKYLKEEDE